MFTTKESLVMRGALRGTVIRHNAASQFGTMSTFADQTLWIFEAISTLNASNKRLRLEWCQRNEICTKSVRR